MVHWREYPNSYVNNSVMEGVYGGLRGELTMGAINRLQDMYETPIDCSLEC